MAAPYQAPMGYRGTPMPGAAAPGAGPMQQGSSLSPEANRQRYGITAALMNIQNPPPVTRMPPPPQMSPMGAPPMGAPPPSAAGVGGPIPPGAGAGMPPPSMAPGIGAVPPGMPPGMPSSMPGGPMPPMGGGAPAGLPQVLSQPDTLAPQTRGY